MTWWWLSFCDVSRPTGDQLLGVAIVRAQSMGEAALVAHRTKCNPGGEVMGVEVPAGFGPPPTEWDHKLVTDKARIDELSTAWTGTECATIAELDDEAVS